MSTGKSFRQKVRNAWKTISWTRVAITTLAVTCFLQFLLIFLFPDGLPLEVEGGSLADWVAAVGTCAIGAGAWRLSLASEKRIVGKEREEKTALLTDMILKGINLGLLSHHIRKFRESAVGTQTQGELRALLSTVAEDAVPMNLSDEQTRALPTGAVFALDALNGDVRSVKRRSIRCIEGMRNALAVSNSPLTESQKKAVGEISIAADSAAEHWDLFQNLVLKVLEES